MISTKVALGMNDHHKKNKQKVHPDELNKETNRTDRLVTEGDEEQLVKEGKDELKPEMDMHEFQRSVQKEMSKFFADYTEDLKTTEGFEDGRRSRVEFKKLQVIDIGTGVISMIGVALAVIGYDLEFEGEHVDRLSFILWIQFASTFIAMFLNLLRHKQVVEFKKSRKLLHEKETLISSGQIYDFIPELACFLLQPYPFLQGIKVWVFNDFEQIDYYYYVNDFLAMCIVVRFYIILRFILNTTRYRSVRSQRLADMYGAENNYIYAIRGLMKSMPFAFSMILLTISILIFGYMVRICERPLNRVETVSQDFNSYWTAMWVVILTMTTVGYGDFYPRTHLGRVVIFIVCIWGVSVVSLMVVTVTNVLTMTPAQEKSLTVMERLGLRKQLKNEAAFILTYMGKIGLARKRIRDEKAKTAAIKRYVKGIQDHLVKFKQIDRDIRTLGDSSNVNEEMSRQFEFMRVEVDNLQKRQKNTEKAVFALCEKFGINVGAPLETSFVAPSRKKSNDHSVAGSPHILKPGYSPRDKRPKDLKQHMNLPPISVNDYDEANPHKNPGNRETDSMDSDQL